MTEQEWLGARFTYEMLLYLEGRLYHWGKADTPPKASDRQIRLFACACCRRIWDLLDSPSRQAVEVAEQYADARASAEELEAARRSVLESLDKQLPGFPHVATQHGLPDLEMFLFPFLEHDRNWKERTDHDFERVWGYNPEALRLEMVLYRAFEAAIDAASSSTWGRISNAGRGWCTLEANPEAVLARVGVPADDPTAWFASRESEHAKNTLLLRHIIGNPFRPYAAPDHWPSTVIQLADALYNGHDCTFALHDALLEAGHPELAEHFKEEQLHPKGCWVLDLLLGKE